MTKDDNRRAGAYTFAVADEPQPQPGRAPKPSPQKKGARRPPSPQEQARRTAVIRAQAEIGYEWQRTRLGKEGKR